MSSISIYFYKFLQLSTLFLLYFFCISLPAFSQYAKNFRNLPDDFPEINLNVYNNPSDGYIFAGVYGGDFFPNATPYLTILDNWGTPVFYRKMDARIYDFKLQENGYLSYFKWPIQYILDSLYRIIDTIKIQDHGPYDTDFHELKVFENGSTFVLGFDDRLVDMDTVVPGGQPGVTVRGCLIQEQEPDGTVVFEWSSWDHYQITDAITDVNLLDPNFIDYVHTNAIEVDSDTTFMISNRNMEEVTKIDRQTGEIIWRMGGKNNQFEFINDSLEGFRRQHDIRKISNGHYTLFDNGGLDDPLISRAIEYALDETNLTATLVNSYRSQPEDIYGAIMGNAQWLPNGNVMVGWGSGVPNITEFHTDGTKAWEVQFESISYRAFRFPWKTNYFIPEADSIDMGWTYFEDPLLQDLSISNNAGKDIYITGFSSQDTAFTLTNDFPILIPDGDSIELEIFFDPPSEGHFQDILTINSDINTETVVQRIAQQVFVEADAIVNDYPEHNLNSIVKLYPNPNQGVIHLTFEKNDLYKISLTNALGKVIYSGNNNGQKYFTLDIENEPSGVYFIQIQGLNSGYFNCIKTVKL